MNRLDKPFKVGDRVVVTQKHYTALPVGTAGMICRIPKARWHANEVTVAWDNGEISTLGCFVLDKIEAAAEK